MKLKKKLLTPILIAISSITLSGCSFFQDAMDSMKDKTNPTETCEHEFDEGVVPADSEATCQKKGKVVYTCTLCGHKENRFAYAPHKSNGIYQHSDTEHYTNCVWCNQMIDKENHNFREELITQYDCTQDGLSRYTCDKCGYVKEDIHPAEHRHEEKEHVDPTCQSAGYISYEDCPGCGEHKDNTILAKVDHHYSARTCDYCGRDELLEYIDDFKSKGTSLNPIIIESETELISLFDYVNVNHITENKYVKVTYSFEGTLQKEMSRVGGLCTAANWTINYGYTDSGLGIVKFSKGCLDTMYTLKSGVDYEEKKYAQLYNPLDDLLAKTPTRSASFDNFKINSRTNVFDNIEDTNQLYYAASHGYKPVCNPGSKAEHVYNEMKKINRQIINDDMTDTYKLLMIYNWLIENIQYDHGAVSAADRGINNNEIIAWGVEGVVDEKLAICDAFSKSFCIFAAIEDIKCIQASGNAHAWNKAYVDPDGDGVKDWYVIDATFANSSTTTFELSNHDEFLYSDSEKTKAGYTSSCYLDVTATKTYNFAKNFSYNGVNKIFLNNMDEVNAYLDAIIPLVKTAHAAGKDVQMEFFFKAGLENQFKSGSTFHTRLGTDYERSWKLSMYEYYDAVVESYFYEAE